MVRVSGLAVRVFGLQLPQTPLTAWCFPRSAGVTLRVLHDRVIRRLGPISQELVPCIVGWNGLSEEGSSTTARPILLIAKARVDVDDARTFTARSSTINNDGTSSEDSFVVVFGNLGGSDGGVESVPDRDWHWSPMHKVFRHEMTVVGPVTFGRRKMNLIEVVDDAVDGVEDGAIGVILPTAMLVHEMEHRRVLERGTTELYI